MPITEGIRKAVYFSLIIIYIRTAIIFAYSYHVGYFFNPVFRVTPVSTFYAAVFYCLAPFIYLTIIYSQAVFINRIGNFFGGAGNFEGAFKIMAFALFLTLLMLIPFVGVFIGIYTFIVIIIGVKEVFNLDIISTVLTVFFAFLFTSFLYILIFGVPALLAKMVALQT